MMYDEENLASELYFPAKRVHPAGMIFNFIKTLKDSILGLGAGTLAFIQQSFFWAMIFIISFAFLIIVVSIISWFRFTFRVEEGELRIERGIFIRKKRYIPIHRIHKIDFSANVIHRIFKLVQVNVDTAGSGGTDASLAALKLSDANKLREALKREQTKETHEDESTEETVEAPVNSSKKISFNHLVIAGVTSGRAGFILLAGLAVFSQVTQYIPDSVYSSSYNFFVKIGLIFAVIIFIGAMVLLWIVGAVGTIIKFGNFTIEKRPAELFIKRGLLETKEFTIPYDRIQAVEIQQSLIRQPFKFARITAVSAGGAVDKTEPAPVIFPLIPLKQVDAFLKEFLPDYQTTQETLVPLPKKARKYFWFKASWLWVLITAGLLYFFPKFALIPAALLILNLLYSQLSFKDSGYALDGKRLIMQNRQALSKVTSIVYKQRIQSFDKRQNKFEQIEKLASPSISVIRMLNQLKHLDEHETDKIADWYSLRH